jgi:hypothetical protein
MYVCTCDHLRLLRVDKALLDRACWTPIVVLCTCVHRQVFAVCIVGMLMMFCRRSWHVLLPWTWWCGCHKLTPVAPVFKRCQLGCCVIGCWVLGVKCLLWWLGRVAS